MNLKKALVIDDEAEIGMLLSTLLSNLGIEALYAQNLEMGLKMYEEARPQLVFLDLNLPDGLGFSLVPKIKDGGLRARVVMITAQDGAKERAMAEHLGVDYLLPKPLSRNNIVAVLSKLENGKW